MSDVVLPRLSDSMEEGVIVAWLKADGDEVSVGEPLAEIETDKATAIYEAPNTGVLRILKREGETLPVGTVIAVIGGSAADHAPDPDGSATRSAPAASASGADGTASGGERSGSRAGVGATSGAAAASGAERSGSRAGAGVTPDAPAASGVRVKASPVARRLAREHGIDLGEVQGTGPRGRITRADIEAAASRPMLRAPAGEPERAEPAVMGDTEMLELTRLQQIVARRMTETKTTVPEFILHRAVDMEAAWSLREGLLAAAGPEDIVPSFNDLAIKAAALALRAHPSANAAFREGRIERYSRVNVGFAVAARKALVVPVVRDADRLSAGAIAATTRAAAQRVRDRGIAPAELEGATFTVSNLGMYGVDWFLPVINPPQAAILGVGAIEERPVASEGEVVVRRRMSLTLVCDHRVIYGADAAELLRTICDLLEQPLRLVL